MINDFAQNTFSLSGAFGALAVSTRLYFTFKRADAQGFRYGILSSAVCWTSSYAAQANTIGFAFGSLVVARSAARSTKWGAGISKLFNKTVGNRYIIANLSLAAMAATTGHFADNLLDWAPMGALTLGTIADTLSKGRKKRPLSAGASTSALSFAIASENPFLILNEAIGFTATSVAIVKHDIMKAAGENQPWHKHVRAYIHGWRNGSATGATIAGQVNVNAGDTGNPEKLIDAYMALPENPHYIRNRSNLPKFGI